MNKKILLFTIFSTFIFSNGWDTQCVVPTGKMTIPNVNAANSESNSTAACSHISGTYFYCYATSEKRETWIMGNPVSQGSSNCNVTIKVEFFSYVDADCGQDAIINGDGVCVCRIPDMIYNSSSKTCSCPVGTTYNGDYCESSCNPLPSPYILWDAASQSDCNIVRMQELYNQNNNDGRTITDAVWQQCDASCYFTINAISSENNNTDNNTSSTNETNNTNTSTIANDGSILAAINNSNVHLSQANDNLGTISNRIQVSGDKVYNEVKYQGDRSHDDTNNLISSINGNHDNLMLSVGNIETNLGYMHNQLTTMIDIMRNGSSTGDGTTTGTSTTQGDGNITVDLDDSRIVEANNNTTKAIKDIFDFLKDGNISDEVLDLNDTLDDSNSSTWSDIMSRFRYAIDDLNISKENLENNIKTELEAQTADLQDKSQNLLTDTLDNLLDHLFNPLQPFIDVGQNINNFKTITIPIEIDTEYIHINKSLIFTIDQFYNSKTRLIFDVLQVVLQLIAVMAGMFYLIRGVTHD